MRLPAFGRLGARFAVILSGEVIQSAFHFGLNVALVRGLSQHDYGVFAIIFIIGGVSLTYIRAMAAVPATLFLPRGLGRRAERGYDVTFGSGATLVAALIAAGVALVFAPMLRFGAISAGAFVGLWAFRSYLRIVLFARGRARLATLSDVVFAGSATFATVFLLHGHGLCLLDDALTAVACGHAVAIGVALIGLRQPVRLSLRRCVRRRYALLGPKLAWSLLGTTSINVQAQGLTLALAVLAGPEAYAPIAATLVLFAPLRIPTNSLTNMALPLLSEHLAFGRIGDAKQVVLRSTALIALGCLLYGFILIIALPIIEQHLFAGRFSHEPMGAIGVGVWAVVTVSLLYAIPRAYLEAACAFRTIASGALVSSALGFAVLMTVLMRLSPPWALLGLLTSEIATLVWSVAAFRDRSRSADPALPRRVDLEAVLRGARG